MLTKSTYLNLLIVGAIVASLGVLGSNTGLIDSFTSSEEGENPVNSSKPLDELKISVDKNESDNPEKTQEKGLRITEEPVAGEPTIIRLFNEKGPIEDKEIFVNNESVGTTDSNGEVGFEVPNTQEITVEASGYSDITRTVEGYTEEIDMSFSFSNTVYQGRSNTLTVTDQESGDALNDASVYANGVEQGQTDSSGQITFKIPEENSVTVKAVKDDSDDNQIFSTPKPPLEVEQIYPNNKSTIDDYKLLLTIQLDLDSAVTATAEMEKEQIFSEELQEGSHTLEKEIIFETSGVKTIELSLDSGSTVRKEKITYDVKEQKPSVEIDITSPDSQVRSGEKVYLNSTISASDKIGYAIKLDGDVLREVTDSGTIENSLLERGIEKGDHLVNITTTPPNFKTPIQTESKSFTIDQALPIASDLNFKVRNDELNGWVADLDYYSFKTLEYLVILDDEVYETGTLNSGSGTIVSDLDVTQGSHSVSVNITDGTNTIQTGTESFEVN